MNKSKKLNPRAKPTILVKYESASNLYKLLNVTNDKTFLSRDVQILKDVFLNEIQKTSNDFLINEINESCLIDKRLIDKREKYKVLPLTDAQKNSKRIFSNMTSCNDITSKISNATNKNSLNNDLILSDFNEIDATNTQKLILEDEKNFFKLRDMNSLIEEFTSNSNVDELNESNHATSKNQFFEEAIRSINAEFAQFNESQQNSQNSLYDDYNEDELALIAKNINFDSITYYNVKASFDSTK